MQKYKLPRRGARNPRLPQRNRAATLALGAALSGSALVANANSQTTIIGSTSSNYTVSGAQDLWFQSVGTIDTPLTPGLSVDGSASNSTITLSAGARLASTIDSSGIALLNNGQVNRLTNAGTIAGQLYGIDNTMTMSLLSNTGTIRSNQTAIENTGTLGPLNNSGLISGVNAIVNTGTMGVINNSGTIAGTISNSSANGLTLVGGSGGTYGTLTGQSGMGSIVSTSSNLTLASGNLLMNDNINAGSQTVVNSGATLRYNNSATIVGNYNQSAGTLQLAPGKTLSVSGQAAFNGGTVVGTLESSANYLAGSTFTLVSAATLTTSGVSVSFYDPTGVINIGGQITGTNLGGTISNNYIGGALSTLSLSGSIASTYGAYIAASGSLGTLNVAGGGTLSGSAYALYNAGSLGSISNAGTIRGNINLGSSAVTISGAGGASFGTLTGGTLSSSATQLALQGGNLLLDDNLNLASGAGTLTSSGGTLQINNRHTLNGNYAQLASETLLIGVADGASATGSTSGDSGYGRLTVSGSANLAAGSSVALTRTGSSYQFANGQRYVVIVANSNGTNYNAPTLNYSAQGFSGTVSGAAVADGGNSDLVLTLGNGGNSLPSNLASQNNAVQALSGLYNYAGTQPALLNLFNAVAAIGSSSEANAVGTQLSPVSTAAANSQVSMATTGAATSVVRERLGELRGGQGGGLGRGGQGGGQGSGRSGGSQGSGVSSGDDTLDHTAWAQAFAGNINQGERDGVSGYRAHYSGLMVGADTSVSDRWTVGSALSFSNSTQNASGTSSGSWVHSHGYGLHGYAGYTADRWYLDLDTSIDRLQYDSKRQVSFTGFSGAASGSYHGTQYSASAEVGWPIRLSSSWHDAVLTPSLALAYTKLEQSAYTETGGNGAALSVGSVHDSSLTSLLGVKLERTYLTPTGLLTPYVQLGWRHEYLDSRLQTTAGFAADSSGATSFTSEGATPLHDSAMLALGATLVKTQRLSFSGRLQFDSGASYAAQSVEMTVRYRF